MKTVFHNTFKHVEICIHVYISMCTHASVYMYTRAMVVILGPNSGTGSGIFLSCHLQFRCLGVSILASAEQRPKGPHIYGGTRILHSGAQDKGDSSRILVFVWFLSP